MVKYDAQKRKLFIGGYVVTVFEGKPEEGIELLEGEEMVCHSYPSGKSITSLLVIYSLNSRESASQL